MYPLLTYGLAFLFGIIFKPILLFPLLILIYFTERERLFLALLVFCTGVVWMQGNHSHPACGKYFGKGQLHIKEISKKTFYGKTRYQYKGSFLNFSTQEGDFYKIPVTLTLSEKVLSCNTDFMVEGTLSRSDVNRGYTFKPLVNTSWRRIPETYSLSEMRFGLKDKLKKWITSRISDGPSASLLSGLATGDFDDKGLLMDFSTLGLSHLLAISGFHFALIAGILNTLLKPFFSLRSRSLLLLLLLGGYFLFLGLAPSIMRAFFMLAIFQLCPFLDASSKGENSLGASLLILLLIEPLAAESAGFILSFLATGAILIIFPWVDGSFKAYFPLRSKKEIYALTKVERIGLIILTFFRQSLALNMAILAIALPVALAIFHQFPPFSVLYNLFFPLLLSFSLLLLILSIGLPWLHVVNSHFTKFILHLTQEVPESLTWSFQSRLITPNISVIILSLIFAVAIYKNRQLKYT